MYDEIKTTKQYLYCLNEKRSAYWKMLGELENKGLYDSPDYHRAIAAWQAYDTAVNLFQELMTNLKEKETL